MKIGPQGEEGTGLGASAECNQVTDPGSCQLEGDRHLNQVLPGAPGTWLDLALLGGRKVPEGIERTEEPDEYLALDIILGAD